MLEEFESSIDKRRQIELGIRQQREIRGLRVRDLSHVLNERQEGANALLRGLRHPEWIATEHGAALLVGFIREEIPQGLDAVDTQFLKIAHDNA